MESIFRNIWEHLKTPISQKNHRIAEHISVYPDPADLQIYLGRIRTALDCILHIWALEYLLPGVRTRHQSYDQRLYISRLCRGRNSKNWELVRVFLLLKPGIHWIESEIVRNFSPEDIFGNLIPKLGRIISRAKPRSKRSFEQWLLNKPVKAKVFRRGYADKGTLRPDDQKRYQELGELGEVQIDEVPFAHPLPFQWTGNENPREPSGERELFLRKVRKSKRKEETNMGMLKRIENLKLQNQRIEEKIQSYQELLRTNRQTIEDIENRFSIHQEN